MPYDFPKSKRLTSQDYRYTFSAFDRKYHTPLFTFLIASSMKTEGGLGVIVSKRKVKKATHRHMLKRCIREFYRQRLALKNHYLIVIAKQKANDADKALVWQHLKQFENWFLKHYNMYPLFY